MHEVVKSPKPLGSLLRDGWEVDHDPAHPGVYAVRQVTALADSLQFFDPDEPALDNPDMTVTEWLDEVDRRTLRMIREAPMVYSLAYYALDALDSILAETDLPYTKGSHYRMRVIRARLIETILRIHGDAVSEIAPDPPPDGST